MKAKDLTGNKIGKLLLTERKRENNRTYYYCKCDCGNSLLFPKIKDNFPKLEFFIQKMIDKFPNVN